MTKIKEIIRF